MCPAALGVVFGVAGALAGCGEDEAARFYRAPKQPVNPAFSPVGSAVEGQPGEAEAPPRVSFVAPEDWRRRPASGMRVATFEAGPPDAAAEVTVIPLSREQFDLAANVNRWAAGQLGMARMTRAEVEAAAEPMSLPASGVDAGHWIELEHEGEAIYVGMVLEGRWFWSFKLSGPVDTARREKGALLAFIESARYGEAAARSATPSAAPGSGEGASGP